MNFFDFERAQHAVPLHFVIKKLFITSRVFIVLEKHRPRKRFGQNFLKDDRVIDHIVDAVAPEFEDPLVEIGPGKGALTKKILPLVKRLDVVELDRDLIPLLENNCKTLGNLKIYQEDALQFNFQKISKKKHSIRVLGNLPYNISTPLLFHLLEQITLIKEMVFMLQKELVDRLVAKPGNKNYGRLSVMVQYYCEVELLFEVPSSAFSPKPKVESAVVKLVPFEKPPYQAKNKALFDEVVREAFKHRRKTLHNNIKSLLNDTGLIRLSIDPKIRPEQLTVAQYVQITNAINKEK